MDNTRLLINTECEPNILTVAKLTDSTRKYSANIHLESGTKERLDKSKLTPLQRGHVYLYFRTRDGFYEITMPYRVFDLETASVCNRLRSFKSMGKQIKMHGNADKSSRNPKSCINHFRLSAKDWGVLVRRSKKEGWILRENKTDAEAVCNEIQQLRDRVDELIRALADFRTQAMKTTNTEDVNGMADTVTELEQMRSSIRAGIPPILPKISMLAREHLREVDTVLVQQQYEVFLTAWNSVKDYDLSVILEEAAHRAVAETADTTKRPSFIGSLADELGRLSAYYPVLRRLKAYGNSVHLDINGVVFRLNPKSITIEGDTALLRTLINAPDKLTSEHNNRFQNLDLED